MSALDELKKKSPIDMTMLEFVVAQAEYSEITGNAEHAAQQLADKDAELLALRAELADAKARAKTAEENWHKNEARVAKLETTLQEMKTDLAQCFMELYDSSFSFADDLAEKYFDSWNEIREVANRQ